MSNATILTISNNAFTRALDRAADAHWAGNYKAETYWQAVARRIARYCEAKGFPY